MVSFLVATMYHTTMDNKTCRWQDSVDVMLMSMLDHTLKCARSVQPQPDVRDDQAFRVLRTAVCDALQKYRTEYDGNECPQLLLSIIRINVLCRYKVVFLFTQHS